MSQTQADIKTSMAAQTDLSTPSAPAGAIVHRFATYVNPPNFNPIAIKRLATFSESTFEAKSCVCLDAEKGGKIFVFYFGAVTFWNVDPNDRAGELGKFFPILLNREFSTIKEEFITYEDPACRPKVEFNFLLVDRMDSKRAEVIATTVAQSAIMEHYENVVQEVWRNLDLIVNRLRDTGTISPFPGTLHKKIGSAVAMRSVVVRVLHLLDRPDLIWDDKIMDTLFNDLRANFDLPERFQALEYKLNLIQETLSILLDTSRDRRVYWLEVTIVILISVEIILALAEKFVR
jgi:uncharacterized Rmd1/YagE family protein